MGPINRLLNGLFRCLFFPVGTGHPWLALITVSFWSTVLILLVFKFLSRQRIIRRKKNVLIAHLMELLIFKDDIVVNVGSFYRATLANLAYLKELLAPMCATILLMAVMFPRLAGWFGAHPLQEDDATIVTVKLREDIPVMEQHTTLTMSDNIVIETQAVRIPSLNEVSWRFRSTGGDEGWIEFSIAGKSLRKRVSAGRVMAPVSAIRASGGLWNALVNPFEAPLPSDSPAVFIAIEHDAWRFSVGKADIGWLPVFLVLCLSLGFLLKGPMRIEI